MIHMLPFVIDDGGRAKAGYKGTTRDCVCRSIAIASGLPYQEVYDRLNDAAKGERVGSRKKRVSSARNGVYRRAYEKVLAELGFHWKPTMGIGTGCKVHLRRDELPSHPCMVIALSRHMTAVVDGAIRDTYDPSRDGTRCVYGYFWRSE